MVQETASWAPWADGAQGIEDWLRADMPAELAQTIVAEFGEENLERLAQAAVEAELAEVRPNPTYADVTAKNLAIGAVRRALGLKELPRQEGEA
jgi:hypothetical protein